MGARPIAGRESVAPTPRGVGPTAVPVGSSETTGTEEGGRPSASVPRGDTDRGGRSIVERPPQRTGYEVELSPLVLFGYKIE